MEGASYEREADTPRTRVAFVSSGFFDNFGVGLIEGRSFDASGHADGMPVGIVNQRFADRYFQGEDALGRRVKPGGLNSDYEWMTIVGVAPNLGMSGGREINSDGIYLLNEQRPRRYMSLLVRARGEPLALTPIVRAEVAAIDPDLPIYRVDTLANEIDRTTIAERTFATLFIVFGLAALLLAVVGLYGVLAFAVRRRAKEIGIRIALGADAGKVLWLTLKGGLSQVFVGLAVGIALAALIAPTMVDMLFDANPWDPTVYLLIAIVLAITGAVASVVPAARATRVDPVETLRYE